jgi:phosphatidylserine/phosphatidylglycerophosphate/cardiolipin synthase-like enzyme
VMQILNRVNCSGATAGGTGSRTKVRVIQYAVYGDRGLWIAKKLRYLWNRGCDVAIIYSVSSRPVLSVLRNRSGRGAVPMRQSVVKDYWGNIVKYNHSKWMTVTGHWGRSTAAYLTFTGSANWANLAFGDDEQMQRIAARSDAARYLATFTKTWRQESSRPPSSAGHVSAFGRTAGRLTLDEPAVAPEFGKGVFRYMTED